MKHTPGPWNIEYDGPSNPIITARLPRNIALVQTAFNSEGKEWEDCTIANAFLIAAAPELLAALNGFRWLGNNLHQIKQSPDEFKSFYESALEDAEKAIAKATGHADINM